MHWEFGADILQTVVSNLIFISATVCVGLKLKMCVFWNGFPWVLKCYLSVISNLLCALEWLT
jgi:ABC-type transport system involved in Fe-S cluster assembly fused permease/ATPase subunit